MYNPLIHNKQSTRLKGYDYSTAGAYFITICTKNKEPFFGTINSGTLDQTTAGMIIQDIWEQIPVQFPFVELDEFVVMPDHIHGILVIHGNSGSLGTRLIASLKTKTGGFSGNHNPMLHQNLSRIIRWYKGRCSFEIRKSGISFVWQSNYYDHIIRDTESYERIGRYIRDNPKNWKDSR